MARPNSIIAAGNNENVPDYDYLDGTVLHVFEPGENEPASATIYSVKGKPKGTVQVLRNGDQVSVAVSGLKNYSIIMRNINHICDLKGAAFEANSMGSKLVPLEGAHNITFKIV